MRFNLRVSMFSSKVSIRNSNGQIRGQWNYHVFRISPQGSPRIYQLYFIFSDIPHGTHLTILAVNMYNNFTGEFALDRD